MTVDRLGARRRSRTRSPGRSAGAASCPCRATTSPSANSCGRVAWRRLNASSWRVRPAPRSHRLLDLGRLAARRIVAARAASAAGRPTPMMLMRMLLKSCATPPASRPIASSFCDCRSCSSSARRSVMSRMNPVMHGAAVGADARDRQFDRELACRRRCSAGQLELPAGERAVAGRQVLARARATLLRAIGRRQQQLDVAAEDVDARRSRTSARRPG